MNDVEKRKPSVDSRIGIIKVNSLNGFRRIYPDQEERRPRKSHRRGQGEAEGGCEGSLKSESNIDKWSPGLD